MIELGDLDDIARTNSDVPTRSYQTSSLGSCKCLIMGIGGIYTASSVHSYTGCD